MAKTATITCGDLSFEASALTLGDLEDIADDIDRLGSADFKMKLSSARVIVAAAWSTAGQKKTGDDMKPIVASWNDLFGAASQVLTLSGLRTETVAPGEAEAGQAPA